MKPTKRHPDVYYVSSVRPGYGLVFEGGTKSEAIKAAHKFADFWANRGVFARCGVIHISGEIILCIVGEPTDPKPIKDLNFLSIEFSEHEAE